MSTTLDQIQSGEGIRYALVAAIEGYSVLLTDHHDVAAVKTAWAATDWRRASSCLRVSGESEQSIAPWQRSFDPNTFELYIRDTGDTSLLPTQTIALDGSQYASISDGSQIGLDFSTAFTIAGWIRFTGTLTGSGAYHTWISKDNIGDRGWSFQVVDASTPRIQLEPISPDGVSAPLGFAEVPDIGDGAYRYVAVVFNGAGSSNADRLMLYIDGTKQTLTFGGPVQPATLVDNSAPVRIGQGHSNGLRWIGEIAHLRAWSAVLTEAQMSAEMRSSVAVLSTDLQAAWEFAGDATDSSAKSNDLSTSGSPSYPAYDSPGELANLIFASAAGNETLLNSAMTASGTGSIDAVDTSNFASAGVIYIGTERIEYSAKTASTFAGTIVRGTYHPFGTSTTAHNLGREHVMADVDYDVAVAPKITDAPRIWPGKYVGVWMHRIVGDTLDTQAEALLVFAGTIKEIQDDASGDTVIACEDVTSRFKATTLLRDQFSAKIREGVYVATGTLFKARASDGSAATDLECLASGASGPYQFDAGTYKAIDLESIIIWWLVNATLVDAALPGTWGYGRLADQRDFFSASNVATGAWHAYLYLPQDVAHFLGWSRNPTQQIGGVTYRRLKVSASGSGAQAIESTNPVNRYMLRGNGSDSFEIHVDAAIGTWMDQTDEIPADLFGLQWAINAPGGTPKTYGLVRIGDYVALAGRELADPTEFHIYQTDQLTQQFASDQWTGEDDLLGLAESEVRLEQIWAYSGSFKEAVLRLLASTGSSGYNEATYDDFPAQMGAAIPWTLLGDQFLDSITALELDLPSKLLFVIDKPVALETELIAELLLRTCWIVWVGGAFKLARFQSPIGQRAIWNFTEANKGSAADGDAQRVVANETDKYLRNIIRFSYNRQLLDNGDTYNNVTTIKHGTSIADYGESRLIEIKARHSYAKIGGNSPAALIANVVSELLPVFGRPVKILEHRTIQPQFYEGVAPGDLATLSDNFMRDPTTGARGVSAKPAIILTHRYGWGTDGGDMYGEVDLLVSNLDNATVYSPAMDMTDTGASGGGYDSAAETGGNAVLYVDIHAYSDSTEDDDATNFSVGDIIDVTEIDPSAGVATGWAGIEILAITDNGTYYTIDIDQDLTGFPGGGQRYRVTSSDYTSATAGQQLDAYQADSDAMVENVRAPFEYASGATAIVTAKPSTTLPERYSTAQYGDGAPYSVAFVAAAAVAVNNLIDYKLAVQSPFSFNETMTGPATATDWECILITPYFMGPGTSERRTFAAAVQARLASGVSCKCRLTLSDKPPSGDDMTNVIFSSFIDQATFTYTSTTMGTSAASSVAQIPISIFRGFGFLSLEISGDTINLAGAGIFRQEPRA